MADLTITLRTATQNWKKDSQEAAWTMESPTRQVRITGHSSTFTIVQDGDDAIASLGYVCDPDAASAHDTLCRVLNSFDEAQIPDLKRRLIGQYVMFVKKAGKLYLFTDFIGGRNLFYSAGGQTISSSLAQAERLEKTTPNDLDAYKVLEFLAMREVMYPAWLGSDTCHRQIKWLLPYEYLVVNTQHNDFRVGSIAYTFDNTKLTDCSVLAHGLVKCLSTVISRPEFKDSLVGATLTGGHDSRLVAGIAAKEYRNIHFRIAVSPQEPQALRDLAVARKVAQIKGVPLDVYQFIAAEHESRFSDLTEEMSPCFNDTITPLLDHAGHYSLGLGGVFGTESFMPLPWRSIDDYLEKAVRRAKRALRAQPSFWTTFQDALHAEFQRLKQHYDLANDNDHDQIRLFGLLVTARYASFILSAFGRSGCQLDPYGTHGVFELALRVPPVLWGNHRRFGGSNLVQKAAMATVDPAMGRVLTHMHCRPMLPLSIATIPSYAVGYFLQTSHWLKDKFRDRKEKRYHTELPGASYTSDGWEGHFIGRLKQRYGLSSNVRID